jgi:predicted ATPase/class 3 adenylate cyclase/regulation of enolase protein 1 (concanavalin A-like superfamily)
MRCPECNSEIQAEDKFCRECGAKISPICPNCGCEVSHKDKFCPECGTKLGESTKTEKVLTPPKLEDMRERLYIPESIRQRRDAAELEIQGENRLVTALFADISGFSHLSNQHSSEKVVNIVNDCFKIIVDTVFRYEGDPNRFIGDNVLAFFGAPIAHENDPERAIMAALEMRDKVKELSLNISIGINTGMMYFGPIGTKEHLEVSAYGPDINLAKRLQETANPDQILIGSGTYKFTKRIFDFINTPNLSVKGFDNPVTAYEVLRVKAHPEKLRGIDGLYASMVGRDREYAELMDSVSQWLSGNGQMVSIIGEAGIGKSRLVKELKSYLTTKHTPNPSNTPLHPSQEGNHNPLNPPLLRGNSNSPFEKGGWGDLLYLEGRCVSIGQPISYWPFIDILRTLFDFKEDDSERDIAKKVREGITKLFPNKADDILPFIGHLMSLKFGDELDKKLDGYSSEQIRHQTMVRLRDIFTALARQNPLLLIIEDLHWSDDLSLDLISLLMDELMTTQMMIVCVYRPEQEHRCMKLSSLAQRKCFESYTEIQLQKLSRVQSSQLVQSLLTIDALPEKVREIILMKSEGNPFFIEEVIRSLIDKGLVYKDGDKWTTRVDISDISVPDTIHGVIMERIDRLESETKYVLQCASVIGRLFRYRLLDHLMSHERRLEQYLDELESKDLVYEERSIPELEYTFKHALTQEATYQTILEQRRRAFHRQVAEGIESLYSNRLEEFYEELAHHHKFAGNDEKAIEYLLKSGVKTAGQFASHDALRYFNQAEELLEKSEKPHRKEKAMLYEKRGEVLQWIGRWIEALREYEKALLWCDDPHNRAEIYRKMGCLESEEMQDKVSAAKHLELGLKELSLDDRSVQRVRLEQDISWVLGWLICSYEDSLLRCRQAAKIAEEMGYRRELAILYAYIQMWQSRLGDYSDEYGRKAIAIAEELGNLPTLAWVYYIVGRMVWLINAPIYQEPSIPYLLRSIEISERIGDVQTLVTSWLGLGGLYIKLGQDKQAIESLEKALGIATVTKSLFPLLMASEQIMGIYGKYNQEDMVISTFSRVMRALASLEIDEETQARSLLRPERWSIYRVYRAFRNGYRAMGKETEFPNVTRKILEDVLENASSRILRAWCYTELMSLNLELGDVRSAQSHAKAVVSIINEMGRPYYMGVFYPAYLLLGEIDGANGLAYRFLTHESAEFAYKLPTHESAGFFVVWTMVERIYEQYGYGNSLQTLAEQVQQTMADALQEAGIQILLEPVELEADPAIFIEQFNQGTIDADWEWVDPLVDCDYKLEKESYLQITVLPDHDLWPGSNLYAPRLLRAISGDFTIETKVSDGFEGKKLGGLLVWKDERCFARFDVASSGSGAWYEGCVYYGWSVAGRQYHPGVHPFKAEEVWLRLERKGNRFTGYVSKDRENWYRCGWVDIPMEDPIKVGIHAICPGLPATSTRFEYFKIYCG